GSARPQPPPSPAQPLPKAPAQGGVAGTYDPNYQTLAGVQGDVFGADKKKPAPNAAAPAAAGPQKPAVGNIMAGRSLAIALTSFLRLSPALCSSFDTSIYAAVISVVIGHKHPSKIASIGLLHQGSTERIHSVAQEKGEADTAKSGQGTLARKSSKDTIEKHRNFYGFEVDCVVKTGQKDAEEITRDFTQGHGRYLLQAVPHLQ
ncbi:hypothetical protein OSTOST_25103, partial [Ostertagia ostertagi]